MALHHHAPPPPYVPHILQVLQGYAVTGGDELRDEVLRYTRYRGVMYRTPSRYSRATRSRAMN